VSIWASLPGIGWDSDELDDGYYLTPRGGQVRAYIDGWSNHYPDDVHVESELSLAETPAWCVPGHEGHGGQTPDSDDAVIGPWLRLGIHTVDQGIKDGKVVLGDDVSTLVVLDEAAVNQLIADLIEWRDAPKVRPVDG
jgi:hypothetical protein